MLVTGMLQSRCAASVRGAVVCSGIEQVTVEVAPPVIGNIPIGVIADPYGFWIEPGTLKYPVSVDA